MSDGPGFIHIRNKHQLIIPDRPGNRRIDSILNIIANPHVGLIFLIPGLQEVLRVNGHAYVIKNREILSEMAVKGKAPLLGIAVDVDECFSSSFEDKWCGNTRVGAIQIKFYAKV
jgi:predicted pyridoxine 5'-phosphate oxidase superfamily flavin-nucleotide-binding protein